MMADNSDRDLAEQIGRYLLERAEAPPERVAGVSQGFLDGE